MFAVLHMLLNSSTLLNPVQSYHPCSHEYTDMQPFAMHCFQWCGGSLKSVSKILGVIYPPLLHWCSQCYMCCSIAPYVNTQSIPEKFMHHFSLHSHSQATCLLPFSPQYCCQPHYLVNINKTKLISTQSHKTENPHN